MDWTLNTGNRGQASRVLVPIVFGTALTVLAAQSATAPTPDPTPNTLDEFRAAATRVLEATGVPGAGIALVRLDDVEWAGGLGFADRDRKTPVTADTHFRVGSISKTFIAIAVVRMYEDGLIDIEAPVDEIASEVSIDNPWRETDPVRVIHLLQHTAGFDDMHFNEIYNDRDPADMPLLDVLNRNPHARRVRWRPGTRMAYSNAGYGVAGYLVEKLSGQSFEDHIESKIFKPLEMHTSSFRLTPADEQILAQGYNGPTGPPTGFPQIYYRPAGNLHSSPREMARFVQMLLNWGELGRGYVVDPEYLSNMERARTSLAATAGVRSGYGSGIAWTLTLPYPVLGHDGGISGFGSTYGYSPSRDVGFVVLLNSTGRGAQDAIDRISSLAIRYLKRDIELPQRPEARVDAAVLRQYAGFYEDANPRNQLLWPVQFFTAGRTIRVEGDSLYMESLFGDRDRLVPVSETAFRRENELDATLVFTKDAEGTLVLAGSQLYAERRPRWRIEIVRGPVLAAGLLLLSPLVVALAWAARLRRARPRGFWELKIAILLCPLVLLAPVLALSLVPFREWGARNAATIVVYLATLGLPTLAAVIAALAIGAWREGASRWLTRFAWSIVAAAAGVTAYLASYGLIGLRLWTY